MRCSFVQPIRIIVAGAAGKVGREICRAVVREPGFTLVGAVDRVATGRDVGEALGFDSGPVGVTIADDLEAVLSAAPGDGAQVMVDFSRAEAALQHVPVAIRKRVAPVMGTTGLKPPELESLAAVCREAGVGGAFVANFAIGAMLMMKFAVEARKYLPDAEIIEMHHHTKVDAPSGTALRTRQRLEAAAGDLSGPQVPIHAVRLPGLVAHQEVIFGGPGQILTIRHDAFTRETYVPGVLLACKWVLAHPGQVAFDLEEITA